MVNVRMIPRLTTIWRDLFDNSTCSITWDSILLQLVQLKKEPTRWSIQHRSWFELWVSEILKYLLSFKKSSKKHQKSNNQKKKNNNVCFPSLCSNLDPVFPFPSETSKDAVSENVDKSDVCGLYPQCIRWRLRRPSRLRTSRLWAAWLQVDIQPSYIHWRMLAKGDCRPTWSKWLSKFLNDIHLSIVFAT